jgi:predicted metal-dependent hydrolase
MMTNLPPYTVRESPRAKRVILRISAQRGLEVVIPPGFSRNQIPRILRQKSAWLERAFRTVQQAVAVAAQPRTLPETIYLTSRDLGFAVEYLPVPGPSVELLQLHEGHLRISGDCGNLDACQALLKRWLQHQGRLHLIPWLQQLSSETGLRFQQIQIRGQKSRWGSCSSRGTISLSYHLLFIRPELVRSLIIHELCHTAHLNHSADFYRLLAHFVPNYRELRAAMQQARVRLPWWSL